MLGLNLFEGFNQKKAFDYRRMRRIGYYCRGKETTRFPVSKSVSQESSLRPLQFFIYINDLINPYTCILFSGDTSLLSRSDVNSDGDDLTLARSSFTSNTLKLNIQLKF